MATVIPDHSNEPIETTPPPRNLGDIAWLLRADEDAVRLLAVERDGARWYGIPDSLCSVNTRAWAWGVSLLFGPIVRGPVLYLSPTEVLEYERTVNEGERNS